MSRSLSELQHKISALQRVAEKHGHVLRSATYDGASDEQLKKLEVFLKAEIPRSHREFLAACNGMYLEVVSDQEVTNHSPTPTFKIDIYGCERIISSTENLRDYIDLEDDEKDLREKAERCLSIASAYGVRLRILSSPDVPSNDNEHGIVSANLQTHDWILSLADPASEKNIARSFKEFLDRSLDNVIINGSSFDYWGKVKSQDAWK